MPGRLQYCGVFFGGNYFNGIRVFVIWNCMEYKSVYMVFVPLQALYVQFLQAGISNPTLRLYFFYLYNALEII